MTPLPFIVLAVSWQSIFSLVLPYTLSATTLVPALPPPENHAEKFFLNESFIK